MPSAITPLMRMPSRTAESGATGRRSAAELKELWRRSFLAADPRQHLANFFKPGDSRGPYGFLRAQGLRPEGEASKYFAVFRPTSLTAWRMMYDGTAVGKALNVKGKSAKQGPLSGFVPFLQISEEAHKEAVGTIPASARTRVFYRSAEAREQARRVLSTVMVEMEASAVSVPSANQMRRGDWHRRSSFAVAVGIDLSGGAASSISSKWMWSCDRFEIDNVDDHAEVFGLDAPARVFWEAYVMRQDIGHAPGWETGRPSEPAYMDMNLKAMNSGSLPRLVIWQHDGQNAMNPRQLLVAHEEDSGVRPVASDCDAFLVGSTGMQFGTPLPADQIQLLEWAMDRMEEILSTPGPQSWTTRWLEVLKKATFHPDQPKYGFGDGSSYGVIEKCVDKLSFCGAVRHGAECFNLYFPQELDDEFLVVWDDYKRYGSKVPFKIINEEGLRSFLLARVDDGYSFPLNPKWVCCDPGWLEVFRKLCASQAAQEGLASWLPPSSRLRERILELASKYTDGFVQVASDGQEVEARVDTDAREAAAAAEWELKRHLVLKRARTKLRAVHRLLKYRRIEKEEAAEAAEAAQAPTGSGRRLGKRGSVLGVIAAMRRVSLAAAMSEELRKRAAAIQDGTEEDSLAVPAADGLPGQPPDVLAGTKDWTRASSYDSPARVADLSDSQLHARRSAPQPAENASEARAAALAALADAARNSLDLPLDARARLEFMAACLLAQANRAPPPSPPPRPPPPYHYTHALEGRAALAASLRTHRILSAALNDAARAAADPSWSEPLQVIVGRLRAAANNLAGPRSPSLS